MQLAYVCPFLVYSDTLNFELMWRRKFRKTDVEAKCSLIRKSCKKQYLHRRVNLSIEKCKTWREVPQRLERMYVVYETDLSVLTAIEELPMLPEFPAAPGICEFVCELVYLFSRLTPGSLGPTEPHLRLVERMPPKAWEVCSSPLA